jgi:hypothetical protein
MQNQPTWPLDSYEHLVEALHEQDMPPEEIAELSPQLLRLVEWQAPIPSPAGSMQLYNRLLHALPRTSPVRQTLQAQWSKPHNALLNMLAIVRAQVSILRLSFWIASVAITLVGVLAVIASSGPNQAIPLYALGPLLACLSTMTAFRAAGLQVMEFELVCPPSLLQLTIARLVLVLSYDIALGLLLSLLFWMIGSGDVLTLTLAWLMPLLLVVGLALLLSLRWGIRTAAALAYGGWLILLILNITARSQGHPAPLLSTEGIVLAGLVGLALLLIAAFSLRATTARLLPY